MGNRSLSRVLLLVAVAAGTLAVCAVPYTALYRNARFSRLRLEELAGIQERYVNDPIFLTYFGRRLNERQQFTQALPVLERAAGLDPDSAPARDEWAKALLGTGQVSLAYGQLRQFLGTHPQSAEAYLLLGKYYVTQQDFEPARRALEESVKRDAGSAEAWSLLAHARIKLGNNGGAQEALEKALRLRPEAADDHLQLATLLAPTAATRARTEYAQAVALAPNDAVCHRQYGRFLLDAGEFGPAERELCRAVTLDGRDPFAAYYLGNCLVAAGKMRDALPLLQQAADLKPLDPVPAEALRRAYRQIGDQENAARWSAHYQALAKSENERRRLEDATIAHPADAEARQRFAAALARIDDVNGCVKQQALALKDRPDSPPVLVAAARDLDQSGYSRDALPLVRQAVERGSSNPEAYETLGDILVHLGRLHEAAVDYERIRDWRANKRALFQQRIADEAARLAASNAPAERLLRQATAETDRAKAETLLQQALVLEPDNTRCLRALLRLQYAGHQYDAALVTARRLSTLAPEDGQAHVLLVILILQAPGARAPGDDDRTLEALLRAAQDDPTAASLLPYARTLLKRR